MLREFVLGKVAGTVIVKESEANYRCISIDIGWSFKERDGVILAKELTFTLI
jgi:hypothetical protein